MKQRPGDNDRASEHAVTRREIPGGSTISVEDRAGREAAITVGHDGVVGRLLAERYVVEAPLGAGGMGIVYAARDLELDRRVAIKLVRPRVDDGAGRARMAHEARMMAKLRHPNIVTVFDIGTVDDRIFLVMELVEGGTLAAWLRARPRSWREIADVFLKALAGLAAAHAAGFVHRDFKPENVLIGSDGAVRVTDFGLARIVDEPAGTPASGERALRDEPPTASVAVSGTPGYIAPEILRREAYDARADQFSLCVALHVALFGGRPGVDRPAVEGARPARVPRWLARIVQRGLAPDPALRWPSLAVMAHAIERRLRPRHRALYAAALGAAALVTSVIVLGEPRAPAQLCRGAERKLAGVWDAARKQAVHAALLATGRPFAEATFTELAASLDRYTGDWVAMHTEACEATQVRGEQSQEVLDLRMDCLDHWRAQLAAEVELLAGADPAIVLRVPQMTAALSTLRQCADVAGLRAPVRPPADPRARARVRALRDRLAQVQALQAAAQAKAGLAIAVPAAAEARTLAYRPVEAEAHYRLGLLQRLSNDSAAAHRSLEDAIFAAHAGRDARAEVLIAAALTSWSAWQAKLEEGHRWIKRGEAAVEAMATRDLDAEATLLTSAAELSLIEGNAEAALAYDRRALALREQIEPPDSVVLAAVHANIGRELDALHRYPEALAELRRALATFEARLGPHHPKVAWARFMVANVLGEQGDLDEASVAYRSSIAIYEAALGPESSELSLPLSNLGALLTEQRKYDEALACLRRSLAITSKVRRPDHPDVGAATVKLAGALVASGQHLVDAEREAQRALALLQRALPPGHHRIARALTILGHAQLDLHRVEPALASLESALEMTSLRPYERPEVQFLMARALWERGRDRRRARALADEARRAFVSLGRAHEPSVAEIDAWLARHR
jgi:tetratricopeptide (TPR) repeat protein